MMATLMKKKSFNRGEITSMTDLKEIKTDKKIKEVEDLLTETF